MNDFDYHEEYEERRKLLKKYMRLKRLHIIIGSIGVILVLCILIYTMIKIEELRSSPEIANNFIIVMTLIIGIVLFSMWGIVFLIESKEEKKVKQINKITFKLRSDVTKRFKKLKETIEKKKEGS